MKLPRDRQTVSRLQIGIWRRITPFVFITNRWLKSRNERLAPMRLTVKLSDFCFNLFAQNSLNRLVDGASCPSAVETKFVGELAQF